MPARNPDDTILSNELNDETGQNCALRKGRTYQIQIKYIMKTL